MRFQKELHRFLTNRKSFWLSFRQVIGGTTLVVSKDNLDFELEESHDIEVRMGKNFEVWL